jgi:hypothetical protein
MVAKEYQSLLVVLSETNPTENRRTTQINRLPLVMRQDCGLSTFGLENEGWSELLRTTASSPGVPIDVSSARAKRLGIETSSAAIAYDRGVSAR